MKNPAGALGRLWKRIHQERAHQTLEKNLQALEQQANAPALDFRAAALNRAGDLCIEAGDADRALRYYGGAIDGYLGVGYYDAAAEMCRKVIRQVPDVVRARCTLAFLSLGAGLPYLPAQGISDDARSQLREYVQAARAAEKEPVAIRRLRMMGKATEVEHIREFIADLLFEIGDKEGAAELVYDSFEERAGLLGDAADSHQQQRDRWAEMLRVTIMGE